MEIKEACEIVEQCTPIEVNGQKETIEQFRLALIALHDLGTRYLEAGEFPSELSNTNNCEYENGANNMRERCLIAYLKKLDAIREKIIKLATNEILKTDAKSEYKQVAIVLMRDAINKYLEDALK